MPHLWNSLPIHVLSSLALRGVVCSSIIVVFVIVRSLRTYQVLTVVTLVKTVNRVNNDSYTNKVRVRARVGVRIRVRAIIGSG